MDARFPLLSSGCTTVQVDIRSRLYEEGQQQKGPGNQGSNEGNDARLIRVSSIPEANFMGGKFTSWKTDRLRHFKELEATNRLLNLMETVAKDITECGSACDAYMKKSFVGSADLCVSTHKQPG